MLQAVAHSTPLLLSTGSIKLKWECLCSIYMSLVPLCFVLKVESCTHLLFNNIGTLPSLFYSLTVVICFPAVCSHQILSRPCWL